MKPAAAWLGWSRYTSAEFRPTAEEIAVADWNGPCRGVRRICLRRLADSQALVAEDWGEGAFYVYHPDAPLQGEWVHTRDRDVSPRCHCWDMIDRGDNGQDPSYGGVPCKHLLAALRADNYGPLLQLETELAKRALIAKALQRPLTSP